MLHCVGHMTYCPCLSTMSQEINPVINSWRESRNRVTTQSANSQNQIKVERIQHVENKEWSEITQSKPQIIITTKLEKWWPTWQTSESNQRKKGSPVLRHFWVLIGAEDAWLVQRWLLSSHWGRLGRSIGLTFNHRIWKWWQSEQGR